jgi:hypothetical protein
LIAGDQVHSIPLSEVGGNVKEVPTAHRFQLGVKVGGNLWCNGLGHRCGIRTRTRLQVRERISVVVVVLMGREQVPSIPVSDSGRQCKGSTTAQRDQLV